MITVTNNFKTAIKGAIKQHKSYVTDGVTEITDSDDLQSIIIKTESNLLHTALRKATITHIGSANYLGSYINFGLGMVLPDTSVEYIDYGKFWVQDREVDKATNSVKLTCYDLMFDSLTDWDLEPIYDIVFPCTLKELIEAICLKKGWTLGTATFPNDDKTIPADIFTGAVKTYREVLEYIAEASASMVYFNTNDELVLKQIAHSTPVETLDQYISEKMTVSAKFGGINSIVLARTPQEDNIAQKDDVAIAADGLFELKLANNWIMDADRTNWITEIYNELHGLYLHPFDVTTFGLGYLEIGDRINVRDKSSNDFEAVVLCSELKITGGLRERFWAVAPDKSNINYNRAGVIGQKIRNTEIVVNKQTGEIQILTKQTVNDYTIPTQATAPSNPELYDLWLNSTDMIIYVWDGKDWQATSLTPDDFLSNYFTKDETSAEISVTTDGIISSVQSVQQMAQAALTGVDTNSDDIVTIQGLITELQQTADALTLQVSGIGGVNQIRNSCGLKGDIKDWQLFDGSGNLIDARNNGTIDQTTDTQINSESHSGIKLVNQFITQSFSTIAGNTYTLYIKYLKNSYPFYITLTGVSGTLTPSTSNSWDVYKYQFVASGDTATLRIENSDSNASVIIADTVVKLGDCSGWIQAPNEVYGSNYRFDRDGFQITSSANKFKALLDNTKLAIYDTSSGSDKIVMLVSKDLGKVTKLTAQDELVLQRYENTAAQARFIPTSTGFMVAVND